VRVRVDRYANLLTPEEGGYTVTVPALSGIATEVDTLGEVIAKLFPSSPTYARKCSLKTPHAHPKVRTDWPVEGRL
jgi:hypothetical protein